MATIVEWNDKKYFGFVMIEGTKVLVHRNALSRPRPGKAVNLVGQQLVDMVIDWTHPNGARVALATIDWQDGYIVVRPSVYLIQDFGVNEAGQIIRLGEHLDGHETSYQPWLCRAVPIEWEVRRILLAQDFWNGEQLDKDNDLERLVARQKRLMPIIGGAYIPRISGRPMNQPRPWDLGYDNWSEAPERFWDDIK